MKNQLGDLISDGMIFENKEVLRPTYVPEKLPHRNEQIKGLADILSVALKGDTPSNILLYGKTGTGKTSTVKYVSTEFEEIARKTSSNCSMLYINGEVFNTQYRVFAYLARVFNRRIPMIGWPTDMVYSAFKNGIDAKERCVIVTLDGIDKLASKGDETLYNLSRINGELNNARISLVGISNDFTFTDQLEQRVKSSLGEEEIIFSPYNVEQLEDILYERAEGAFNDAALDGDVIPLCAAFAASGHGGARCALDLLRVSGEIAERSRSKKVYDEHVRLASEMIETDKVVEVIETLPLQSKIVLSSVLLLGQGRNKRSFSSGEVYTMYQQLCNRLGMAALTQRRVTDFVSELEFLGLINAVIVNKGRYGRTKAISLSISEDSIQPVLFADYKLKAISTIAGRTPVTV